MSLSDVALYQSVSVCWTLVFELALESLSVVAMYVSRSGPLRSD